MSDPEIALYVSSNEVDHGPLSLKEASKRVQSGEFKPEDLAWHQGVSGWVPLKDLPEWNAMQAPPPLEKKEGPPKLVADEPAPKLNLKKKGAPGADQEAPRPSPAMKRAGRDEFEDEEPVPKAEGMGFIGKALVGFAMLVFLGTLGVVGFFVYKNLDKFTQ